MPDTSPLEAMRRDDHRLQAAIDAVPVQHLNSYQKVLARADAAEQARRVFTRPVKVTQHDLAALFGWELRSHLDEKSNDDLKKTLRSLWREVTAGERKRLQLDYDAARAEIEAHIWLEDKHRQRELHQTRRTLRALERGQLPLPSPVASHRHNMTLKQIRAEQLTRIAAQ